MNKLKVKQLAGEQKIGRQSGVSLSCLIIFWAYT